MFKSATEMFHFCLPLQFRTCLKKMLGMSASEDEEGSSTSVTEVSKVGPA